MVPRTEIDAVEDLATIEQLMQVFLWVYDATANDPVLGKRRKTGVTAVDFSTLPESVRNDMMAEFIRSNNAPSIVGSTLVFPAVSTARIVNSTLII